MAISQNTLIGSTKQSVGGVTFTKWKGRNVIKAKAVSVANPQTPAQTANRNRFAGVSQFYSRHKAALSLSFLRLMGNITDGNMFNRMNRLVFSTEFVGIIGDSVSDLVLSAGSLGVFSEVSVIEATPDSASVSYTYFGNVVKALPTDLCRIVLYNKDRETFVYSDQTIANGAETIIVPIAGLTGDVIHAWIYSYSSTGRNLSDSAYCGSYIAS